MPRPITLLLLLAASVPAAAQPVQPPKGERLPVDVVLEAAMAAYSHKPCADEMTVKFRATGAGQKSDHFVIRLDPGDTPRSGPRRMFLDMGQLKIYAENGKLTAINTAAPGKYAQKEFTPPLTPAVLASFLPPVPLPQLALSGEDLQQLKGLTPYTADITWTAADPDVTAKPETVVIQGSGPSGTASFTVDADTGRLTRFSSTSHGRSGDSTLELTIHGVDPGDPASWMIKTEGRERVATVADLKPTPRPNENAAR